MQKQNNIGSVSLLAISVFFLLFQAARCQTYKILDDCPKSNVFLQVDDQQVASLALIKYPGTTGDFYNKVWEFENSEGLWALRIGNTDNKVYLYYSWDVYHFSCDASSNPQILPQVIFNYGGKNEVVNPIRYICKANNGYEKKKRSIADKKLQSRARLSLDHAIV
ncbi:hypothetical protein PS6_004130 [Mucor atramentarius]